MEILADGLLIVTALTAGIYCAVLSRRLRRLGSPAKGIAAQIATLNAAVEETRAALTETRQGMEALRTNAVATGERLRRDLSQARRQKDELQTQCARASVLLDRLHRVDADRGDDVAALGGTDPASNTEPVASAKDPDASEITHPRPREAADAENAAAIVPSSPPSSTGEVPRPSLTAGGRARPARSVARSLGARLLGVKRVSP